MENPHFLEILLSPPEGKKFSELASIETKHFRQEFHPL